MRLRFDDLPRSLRERLVQLSHAPQDASVVIRHPDLGGSLFKYVTLIAGLGGCFVALHFLMGRRGVDPRHDREVFLGLAAGAFVVLASIGAIAFERVVPPTPYLTGTWALTSYLLQLTRG